MRNSVIAEQRRRATHLAGALKAEAASANQFIATAEPKPGLIGSAGADDMSGVSAAMLRQWLETVVASRDHYPTWVESHQVLDQLQGDGLRELPERLLAATAEGENWSRTDHRASL